MLLTLLVGKEAKHRVFFAIRNMDVVTAIVVVHELVERIASVTIAIVVVLHFGGVFAIVVILSFDGVIAGSEEADS